MTEPTTGGLLRPRRLRPGDRIAVAAPSGPATHVDRLDRGVRALKAMGFDVVVGATAGGEARSAAARAAEMNEFISDPAVRCIVAATGGYSANGVLDRIEWATLRDDPTVLIGYSDITALLMGAVSVAGVVAFHGPTVLPEFAEYPDPAPYTSESFVRAVTSPEPPGVLDQPDTWTEEFLAWGVDDVRPRTTVTTSPLTWLGEGQAQGRLLGGNLETLCALAGTRYFPRLDGAVLLLEPAGTDLAALDRDLDHLTMLGAFAHPAAVLVGHSFRGGDGFEDRFRERLAVRFEGARFPVALGMHFGHTDPMPTLPLGARVRVDSSAREVVVLDAGVR